MLGGRFLLCENRHPPCQPKPQNVSAASETLHVIDGPSGPLELRLLTPAPLPVSALAVVCHPHPLHGGSMDNKVVYTLSRLLAARGALTVRFNFRGVGKSAGSFDHGTGEQADLDAVTAWLRQYAARQDLPLTLAGFSFGSFVAAISANRLMAQQLISVAPPVQRFDFDRYPLPTCPWLIVMGDADEVVAPDAVFTWAETLPSTARLIKMAGASHYFHGRLIELREQIERALT